MKSPIRLACSLAAAATLLLALSPAQAAPLFTTYGSAAAWDAAAGGTILTQDFEGYAGGTNMSGVSFLPGVSATTSMSTLSIFGSSGNNSIFGSGGRTSGTEYYDINFALPYGAVGFDIYAFESDPNEPSTAVDSGLLTVYFADSTSVSFDIFGNPNGDNIFFGIVADTAIARIRWAEAHEASGGNEETALDNFRVRAVPEPPALALAGSVLALAGLIGRRRKR